MSEVEETKTPDSTVKEEKQETAVTEDASEKDAASEISAKDKDVDNKGTVLDVFKKFAASTGPSWADMMVEEASQAENEEQSRRLDEITKATANFKSPFIVYVSNMNPCATAEDIYYFFGGKDSVCDVFRYGEGQSGEALVELESIQKLVDALMKNESDFFKKKLNIEYVDGCKGECYHIPRPNAQPQPFTRQEQNDRGPSNRMNSGVGRRNRNDRAPPQSNKQPYDNRPPYESRQSHDNRQPQRHTQSNDVRSMHAYRQTTQAPQPLFNIQTQHSRLPNPPAVEAQALEPKPVVKAPPKVSKPSPFGQAKPNDKVGENMRKFEETIKNEKEVTKQEVTKKKTSISSQQSQQTVDDQQSVVNDQKPEPINESTKSSEVVDSDKKPYNSITVVPSSKRRNIQHPRSDYGSSHSRGVQKINAQPIQKFLGMSQKQVDSVKEGKPKHRSFDSDYNKNSSNLNGGQERRFPKRRYDRKDSSATNYSTTGPKENLKKQSSVEKSSPSFPAPTSDVPPLAPTVSNPNSSVENTAVSTPTTNEPPTPNPIADGTTSPTPAKAKSKKSKKKKNSTAGSGNNMFSALNEVRD